MPEGPFGGPRPFAKDNDFTTVNIQEARKDELKVSLRARDEEKAEDIVNKWIDENIEGGGEIRTNANLNEMVFRTKRGDSNTLPTFEATVEIE